jgi:hypothetical protein
MQLIRNLEPERSAHAIHKMECENNLIKQYIQYLWIRALEDLIGCDVIFWICIVDSVDGRYLISQLTNFYLVPYFIGLRLMLTDTVELKV